MKYALLVVEHPERDMYKAATAIDNFLRSVEGKLRGTPKATMLNAYCWICPLTHGLHELSALVDEAKSRGFATRTLFFDQEPSFVISKP